MRRMSRQALVEEIGFPREGEREKEGERGGKENIKDSKI